MELQSLISIFGEAFLRYVLAIEESIELDDIGLSDNQKPVADFLSAQLSQLPNAADATGFAKYSSLAGLGTYVPNLGTSLANALRQVAGGEPPQVDQSEDEVLNLARRLASDIWPPYLLPAPSGPPRTFWMSTPLGMYQHPVTGELCRAFLQDKDLAKLFPDATLEGDGVDIFGQAAAVQSMFYSNTGRGGSQQLVTTIGFLISDAVFRAYLLDGLVSWKAVHQYLADTLDAVRKLASGKVANVPVLLGLSGIRIVDDTPLSIAGGKLRKPRPADIDILLNNTESVTAIFETTFPLKLLRIDKWSPEENQFRPDTTWDKLQPRMEETQRSFQRNFDLARLALLLGSSKGRLLLANQVSRFLLDPTTPGGVTSWESVRQHIVSNELKTEDRDSIVEWHQVISQKHVPSLDIGMRRLLAATTTRLDANDAFVDAVVCWENVFGTATETVFRVTGALAKLLEPSNLPKRQELQRELKKLYDKRSGLIHGGKEPSVKEAFELKERATELAIDCLRVLYRDRPDLLELPSADRSAQVLME